MSLILCDNAEHQTAVTLSAGREQSDKGIAEIDFKNGSVPYEEYAARVRQADIDHHRRCLASARAHGLLVAAVHEQTLRELGAL